MPISIGIPFYNAEAFLADAIRSVFAQSYQDWELILVDDGSTDGSLEIARSVRDPRVRVISDGTNKRLPYRLNQITAEARYPLIGRMDADDLISPTRFEKQVRILDEHPELDLVTTGVCSVTNDRRPVGVRCGSPDDEITGRGLLTCRCAVVHAAMLGRRAWFQRNPYDPAANRAEDYELWLRAFSKNDFKLHILNEPLYYYREEENITPKRLIASYRSQRGLYRRYAFLGLSRGEVAVMLLKSLGKSLTIRLLAACGRLDLLLERRNSPIEDVNLVSHFDREIQQVLATRVPGLD
ncbi:hypothetical protein GMSM_20730 [Geomonas sp. Red276]